MGLRQTNISKITSLTTGSIITQRRHESDKIFNTEFLYVIYVNNLIQIPLGGQNTSKCHPE